MVSGKAEPLSAIRSRVTATGERWLASSEEERILASTATRELELFEHLPWFATRSKDRKG